MKRALVVTLVCINAALLLGLVIGVNASDAKAQGMVGARTDYLIMTGHVGNDNDAVYVVDVRRQGMVAFRFDRNKKKLIAYRGVRKLKTDYRRAK